MSQESSDRIHSRTAETTEPKERTIILDVPAPSDTANRLVQMGFTTVESVEATAHLLNWHGWSEARPQRTLVIFPGRGAQMVRDLLPRQWLQRYHTTSVHAERRWVPGENPVCQGGRIPNPRLELRVEHVVVVDDVVSSGVTCQAVRKWNQLWFPRSQWSVLAWVKQQSASLRGYSDSFAPTVVGVAGRRTPINSLSTLLREPEMAERYLIRNRLLDSPFAALLHELRQR